MKGRYSTVILLALIAVLVHPNPGFSKRTGSSKSSGKHSSAARSSEKKSENSDADQTYVIRSGDSLYSIAKAFNTTPKALKALNNFSRNRIKVGQTIKVPASANAAVTKEASEPSKSLEQSYKVRSGDNFSSIAKAFNTTPDALKAANNLKSNRLKAGQILKVPAAQSTASNGDYKENSKTQDPVEASLPVNPRKPNGQEPILAAAAPSQRVQNVERRAAKESREIRFKDYVIHRGDSLFGIAKSFNITPKELKAANKLKNNRIKVGQTLKIPVVQTAMAQAKEASAAKVQDARNQLALSIAALKQAKTEEDSDTSALPLQERLVEAGFKMLGVRYRFSGTSEKTGLDCSALVRNLFSKININLPRSSREQYQQGEKVDRDNLQVGDLVFFSSGGKTPTHVGVYIGNNQFLHAARKAKQVIVSDLNKIWYNTRYIGARRIMNLWWEDPETPSDSDSKDK